MKMNTQPYPQEIIDLAENLYIMPGGNYREDSPLRKPSVDNSPIGVVIAHDAGMLMDAYLTAGGNIAIITEQAAIEPRRNLALMIPIILE